MVPVGERVGDVGGGEVRVYLEARVDCRVWLEY